MLKKEKEKEKEKAFTLIEALVAVFVFTFALTGVLGLILLGYKTQTFSLSQSQAIAEARKGVDLMVKEIRGAKTGDDGAFVIEKAEDYEFIFYSDIDKDQATERVRYFIKPAGGDEDSLTDQCVSFSDGGTCDISFADFLGGELETAQVLVSAEGDLNSSSEIVDIFADGEKLGTVCAGGDCGQCAGAFEDLTVFDVSQQALDNFIQFTADSSSKVGAFCDWQEPNHSVKARFQFVWTQAPGAQDKAVFKKGIINPAGWPAEYLAEQEQIFVISENIQNETRAEPVFTYFDEDNNPLGPEARLEKTVRMSLNLIINVNPQREPDDFKLESDVQLRNLKTNL